MLGKDFVEIYVDCPIEVCESRDPKEIYKKARNGEIKDFTGIDSPYEIPDNPEIVVFTQSDTVEQCVNKILDFLSSR